MPSERDLFANFERMRREMEELFGDAFERTSMALQGGLCFAPRIDVYYRAKPAQVVITAELAGIDRDSLEIEIEDRQLVIAGTRRPAGDAGGDYQQIEIEHGQFRRVIQLAADVRAEDANATYSDGLLRIEIPLFQLPRSSQSVPVEVRRKGES